MSDEAVLARSLPFVESFFKRRGLPYRGAELESLICYVLSAVKVESDLVKEANWSASGLERGAIDLARTEGWSWGELDEFERDQYVRRSESGPV